MEFCLLRDFVEKAFQVYGNVTSSAQSGLSVCQKDVTDPVNTQTGT